MFSHLIRSFFSSRSSAVSLISIVASQLDFIGLFSKGKSRLKIYLNFIFFSNFLCIRKSKSKSKLLFSRSIDDSDSDSDEESGDEDLHDMDQYEEVEPGAHNPEVAIGHNDPGNGEAQLPDLGYESATEIQALQAEQDGLREIFDSSEDEDETFA